MVPTFSYSPFCLVAANHERGRQILDLHINIYSHMTRMRQILDFYIWTYIVTWPVGTNYTVSYKDFFYNF